MSYKLLSLRINNMQEDLQWQGRNIDDELTAFEGRTATGVFNKYLLKRDMNIIEAGCGIGAWCEWLRRKKHSVIGLEHNKNIVSRAKTLQPDIPVEWGDVTAIKYEDNSFDAYISLGVIEHFENGPEIVLREALRVLKSEGLAIVSVPLLTPLRRFVAHPIRTLYFALMKLRGKRGVFWEYRYTRHELRSYIERAGFEIIDEQADDYEKNVTNRHIGLWADWFFLRKKGGGIWELNIIGKLLLRTLKILPGSWYCSGWLVVARAHK